MSNPEHSTNWAPPLPGHWRRDFRLAEWLPGPVSASCETWLLPQLDRGFSDGSLDEFGSGTKQGFVVVNGWCFSTDPMPTRPIGLITTSPLRMARIAVAMARMGTRPESVERWVAEPGYHRYRSVDLPRLQAALDSAEGQLPRATPTDLVAMVDGLAQTTGYLMLGMVQALGFAGKLEYALARFFADHLAGRVECRPLDLTVGHAIPQPTQPHAVVSLDWREPTAGERAIATAPSPAIRQRLVEARRSAEATCRDALTDPRHRARFDELVTMLGRWIPVRESMAAEFTLAWPTMRRALSRIGTALVDAGIVAEDQDVYDLTRAEIESALAGDPTSRHHTVAARRASRAEQLRLAVPVSLGKPVRQWKHVEAITSLLRTDPPAAADVVVAGIGSSPGTVTGVARIVRGPEEFDAFQPGEILVAPGTAPAWTPLLEIAAGVVTEGGGPFAHTSVVAREFGIPAIVTAAGATWTISNGTVITLDAASGTVSRAR